jgi:hypothetical protein
LELRKQQIKKQAEIQQEKKKKETELKNQEILQEEKEKAESDLEAKRKRLNLKKPLTNNKGVRY